MLEQIIPFLLASVLLTISPGPDIIYVLVQSISNGSKAGLMTTLGLVSGILIHTSFVAFGVSAVIKQSDILFLGIKLLGAIYLFYLAYKVFQSDFNFSLPSKRVETKLKFKLLKQGFIMNVLNPKVTIFFLAFFPGFLWDTEVFAISQFYILGFLFMLQALLIFGVVALTAGKIAKYLKGNTSFSKRLKWIQIFVYIGIGFLILF